MDFAEFLKKPASKQDLIVLGIAMWLADSGQGEKGVAAIQGKLRDLLGAEEKKETPAIEAAK